MATNFLVVMRLTEQVSRPLRRAANSANQMTESADRMSAQLNAANGVLVGFGAAAVAGLGVAANAAATLEDRLARLETVTRTTTGTVEGALSNAESAAREFSTSYTASVNEVLDAQFQLATAGIAVEEQVAATQGAFKLARATVGDFTQTAQLLGSFLNTFGKSVQLSYLDPMSKVGRLTDTLSAAVQRFQATLPVLAEGFKFVVGPASTLGLKFEETTAALGVLNTAGFRGALAGTAISNTFNKLDRAVEKLDLQPDKFIDLNGNLKDLASFLEEVNRALGDSTPIEQQNKLIEVFDIRAGRVIKTLINNVEAIKRFTAELEIAQGATDELSGIVENTASASFQKLLNSVENLASEFGKSFVDTFKSVAPILIDGVVAVTGFIESNKTLTVVLLGVVPAVVATGVAVATLTSLVSVASTALKGLVASSTALQVVLLPLRAGARLVATAFGLLSVATKSLISSLVLASRTVLVFTGRMAVAAIGALKLRGVILVLAVSFTGLAASIGSAVAAVGAFIAAIAPFVAIFAVVVGLAAGLVFGVRALVDAFSDSSSATDKAALSTEQITARYGNAATQLSKFNSELSRLNKTIENQVDIPVRDNEVLGRFSSIGARANQLAQGEGFGRLDAVKNATEQYGNFRDILIDISNVTGQPATALLRLGERFQQLRSSTDRAFDGLSELEKGLAFTQSLSNSYSIALRSLTRNNEEAGAAILKLTDAYARYNKAQGEVQAGFRGDIFETIVNNLDTLRNVDSGGTQGIVKFFDDARRLARDTGQEFQFAVRSWEDGEPVIKQLSASSSEFFGLIRRNQGSISEIGREINGLAASAQPLEGALTATNQTLSQIRNSTKGVENVLKNAEVGGGRFAEAIQRAQQRLEESRTSLRSLRPALEELRKRFESLQERGRLIDTDEFGEARKILESALETEVQLRTAIEEERIRIQGARVKQLMEEALGGDLQPPQFFKNAERLGSQAGTTIGNALSGQLDGATLFGELANDFRTRFITDIQKQIGQLFGAQFARDFQTAITQAQNIIAEASRGGTLLFDLDSGTLQDRINDAINAAAPGLRKLTGGDIFDLGGGTENKLVEQFRNVFTDASVALVTAGNESAAILERLQGVLSQGPGRSVSELTTQAAELRRLLVQASTSGATDAVRPVEQALRNVLSQLQQSGPPTAVQQIGNATQQATAAIDTSANRFASAVQSLVPAGREFASIISEAVGGAGVAAAIQTGAAQTIQRNVEVSIQNTDQIDVTLAGGANGNVLEEDEIRQIIDQTRDEMEADLEERLRRLEDELRSR